VRIAIVSDYYYPQLGGVAEHVHGQATELSRRGHEVTVVTPKLIKVPRTVDAEILPPETFEVVRLARGYPFYANRAEVLVSWALRLGASLERLFEERRFDVVHVHNPIGPWLAIAAVRRSRAPVTVGTLHSVVAENYPLLRIFQRPLTTHLRRLDACITVSDTVVDSLGRYLQGQQFVTIPNGVDASFFTPDAEPLPELAGKRNMLFVGRFDPRNGVGHAIAAWTILRRTRDDVRLVIVGDGPLRPIVERLVPEQLRQDVVFAGRVNRLRPRYLASADVLCSPCSLASFGMVVLEGMSAGVPVVATHLPGFARVMRNGVDGLMIEKHDDDAGFARALERVLGSRPLAEAMGAAGRRRALGHFAWPVVVDRLEDLYERLGAAARNSVALRAAA
jgi:phosphatidylinositol alpha-mannosyltransferase